MARLVRILLVVVAGLVGLAVLATVAIALFFDPNDYRDRIAIEVEAATGREFVIEGDLSLSYFPWLAIEIGRTRLGNAAGFSDEPMVSFESASLRVKLLPLIFRRDLAIGTASLDGLSVILEVGPGGGNNWDDLATGGATVSSPEPGTGGEAGGDAPELDVANIRVDDARLVYRDAQAGVSYSLTGLSVSTGRIASGEPFDLETAFDFDAGDIGGHLELRGRITLADGNEQLAVDGLNISATVTGVVEQPAEFNFDARAIAVDMAAETVSLGEMDTSVLGVSMTADVAPFSYAGTPAPTASLRVMEFSLKDLMQTMGTEPPATADEGAMTRVSFSADAAVGDTSISLTSMELRLDDTTMNGSLTMPTGEDGMLQFDLIADSITLDHYMAPPGDDGSEAADASSGDEIELPVELIRSLNARGKAKLVEARLSGMTFENLEVGLASSGGKLRLHPLSADLFDGTYRGDIRIDASGTTPSISVDENISGVSMASLAQSMFEQENITGTIDGRFVLSGSGDNLAEIRSDLDGTMSFQLADGAWEGTDVWHQLRTARAMFKQETPPQARQPVRTEFTAVTVNGIVTDGVFRNDELLAELPFLRLTGDGTVDIAQATVDYAMEARVLEQPEFVDAASEAELSDFTEAVIPLIVSGPLASPSIKPDIEALVRREVQREVEKKGQELIDRLLGGDTDTGEEGEGDAAGDDEEEEKSPEDKVKDALKDIFGRQ